MKEYMLWREQAFINAYMESGDIHHADHNIIFFLRRVGDIKEDKEANWPSVHVSVVSRSGYKIKYVVDISKIKKIETSDQDLYHF